MKLSLYVAFLRCLYLLYQNAHWQSKGQNGYSLHLLFEKLYSKVSEDVDDAAEITAVLIGHEVLDIREQLKYFQSILSEINEFDDFLKAGLAGELAFQKMSKNLISELESINKLDPGLDDVLRKNIRNSRQREYLLKLNIT